MTTTTNIVRLSRAKKMHTTSGVPAPMTWLVFTLGVLSSVATAVAAVETRGVKVITTPVFPQIPRLQASKDFQVLVRVEAAQQQTRRVPVDLAVVVDVGGGSPARLESVKKAVKFIIRQIHDDDRLAVVVGPSNHHRPVTGFLSTPDARWNAENFVDEMEPRTGDRSDFTSGAGLVEAFKILGELPAETAGRSSSRARFVILVTDTAAATTTTTMTTTETPVHTFGLGEAHDPRALLSIARKTQGTYSFVDDDHTDGITAAIAVCLGGLKDVVAVGARLRVEAPVGSGVTVDRIDSGRYITSAGEVAVGVLYAGEVKSFIVHLSVPALPPLPTVDDDDDGDSGCDKQHLLTATFVVGGNNYIYTTNDDGEEDPTAAVTQTTTLYVHRPPPEALGGGALALQRVPIPVVMDHMARFGVLDIVTTFVDDYIWRLSSSSVVTVDAAATKLRTQWEQFVQERQFWSGLDLGVLHVEVTRMVTRLSGSSSLTTSAVASVLSWLSSYEMQRPTAMGSPDSVADVFVTVNMRLTLQQATSTTTITAAAPLCDGSSCPACRCVKQPPPVLVESGQGDGTYRINAAYPQDLLLNAINQAMEHMYLALVQASNLTRCGDDAAAGVKVVPASLFVDERLTDNNGHDGNPYSQPTGPSASYRGVDYLVLGY